MFGWGKTGTKGQFEAIKTKIQFNELLENFQSKVLIPTVIFIKLLKESSHHL
jgi:hypothetical protein